MNQWKYVKLGEVCTIERGGSPRPIDDFITTDENGINWIKIGDADESMYITKTAQRIKPEGMKKSRYVKPGDFLLSNSMSFGRPYILKIDGCIHDGWLVLRDENNVFDKKFLYYYLSAPITYKKFKSMAVGGVVNNLNSDMVRKVRVPVPSQEEQHQISDRLDRVSNLIFLRKQQLAKLDELVKARFVEMFGKPIENTMNWPKKLLRDITTKIGSGATPKGGRESYPNAGVSLIRSMNVYDGQFLYKDLAHLTDEQATQLNGVTVEAEDVLVNITGASVARSCVVPKDVLPARVNQHVAIVRCNRELLNPIFTNKMFINNEFKKELLSIGESGGATRQAITKKQLEELSVVVPPLSIQNEFFTFSECVDQQKQTVQQSLDKLELMKKALMQEYFG